MNVAFPPPLRWQDFEELTVGAVRSVFDDPGVQGHGRSGQRQNGVDVYGQEAGSGRIVGVQCKQRHGNPDLPGDTITDVEVREEAKRAEKFEPRLDYFIVATTGSRDTGLQAHIRSLQGERLRDGLFPVGMWFWEDFVGFLNADARLSQWYGRLLDDLYGNKLADKQILSVMRTAFGRAAFRTPLHAEAPAEFRQALLDTERVINTGLLLDRETRMPLCRAPSGLSAVTCDPDGHVPAIMKAVQSARLAFDQGLANGRIEMSTYCIQVIDPSAREVIDRYRADALVALNHLLEFHGEDPVDSPLLAMPPVPRGRRRRTG